MFMHCDAHELELIVHGSSQSLLSLERWAVIWHFRQPLPSIPLNGRSRLVLKNMEVFMNGGIQKWMVYEGKSIIKMDDLGVGNGKPWL